MKSCIKSSLSFDEIEAILDEGIVNKTLTGIKIDSHAMKSGRVLIYQKNFYGARELLSVTVIMDHEPDCTFVHWIISEPEIDFFDSAGRFDKMIRKIFSADIAEQEHK